MLNTARNSMKPNPLWEMYIQQGNADMRDELYSKAQAAYIQAMELAENLLENSLQKQGDTDTIHEFVISCQYLAELYYIKGLGKETESLLLKARKKALGLMKRENISVKFRKEAFRAFHVAHMDLVSFYRSCEFHEKMADIIRESRLHSQKFLHDINHQVFERN